MKIKSASDVEAYCKRTKIPEACYNNNLLLASEAVALTESGPGMDSVMPAYDYGFAKGWRAAMKYQKDKARRKT